VYGLDTLVPQHDVGDDIAHGIARRRECLWIVVTPPARVADLGGIHRIADANQLVRVGITVAILCRSSKR
jgi:hypothetical protein